MVVIEADKLSKKYRSTWALRNVSFTIKGRGLTVVYGPNGSGKSTLFRLIAGLEKPSSGTIMVNGVEPGKDVGKINRAIAYYAEGTWVPPYYTGVELVEHFTRSTQVDTRLIRDLADSLRVTTYWRKMVAGYSMGMRKKLLLLLTMAEAEESDVILLDEPYTLLDTPTKNLIGEWINKTSREKLVLNATHILTEAEEHAQYGMVLVNGKLKTILKAENSPSIICKYNQEIINEASKHNSTIKTDPQKNIVEIHPWKNKTPKECRKAITLLALEEQTKETLQKYRQSNIP